MIPENVLCSCPGEVLSFKCNVVGGGSTIWSGTALQECGAGDIILRHDRFGNDISRICSGAIIIESLGVSGDNCYNSQLNVTVSDEFNNTSIKCLVNDGGIRTIGESNTTVVPGILIHVCDFLTCTYILILFVYDVAWQRLLNTHDQISRARSWLVKVIVIAV